MRPAEGWGCDDDPYLRELRLRNALIEAFLSHRGDDVFEGIAEALGVEFFPHRGVVAWAESWGSYAVVAQDRAERLVMQADQWARLPGEGGWRDEVVRIGSLAFPDGPLDQVVAVPLRDNDAAVAFVGLTSPEDGGRNGEDDAVRLLSKAVAPLQVFTVERINESRRESMRRMTEVAYKKSERRFQDFIEGSKDMIYIADGAGTIVLVNKAGEELLGAPRPDILGQSFVSFCPNAGDREFFDERLRADGFVKDFELTLQRRDGSVIVATESATAIRGEGDRVVEVHGIVRDITERLRSQRELWTANLELAEMNETLKKTQAAMVQQEKLASIGQLAAGIAHEINNPLGFLMSDFQGLKNISSSMAKIREYAGAGDFAAAATELAESDVHYLIDDLPEMLSEMEDGFSRISEIVKNLRSFARSTDEEERTPYDLNAGIERALVIARNEIKYVANVALALGSVSPVEAIKGEVDQVLLNVLVNAAQAIGAQGRSERGQIAVRSGAGNSSVWVEIEDDGPGIPESVGKRIFEPFFTTKEPGKGTGLGLSISYDIIVRKHGGSFSFRPRPGGGTCFRIELPDRTT